MIAVSLGFEAGKQGWAQLVLNPGAKNDNTIPFLGDNNLVAVGMAMLTPILSALAATSTGWSNAALSSSNVGIVYRDSVPFPAAGSSPLARWPASRSCDRRKARTLVAGAIVAALILPVLPPAVLGSDVDHYRIR